MVMSSVFNFILLMIQFLKEEFILQIILKLTCIVIWHKNPDVSLALYL
jgi:hypothetical protein